MTVTVTGVTSGHHDDELRAAPHSLKLGELAQDGGDGALDVLVVRRFEVSAGGMVRSSTT